MTTLVQSSSETRSWLQALRDRLQQFEYNEAKYWAAFGSQDAGGVFAYLNPVKRIIRLFLRLDPEDDPQLRPTPGTHHWAERFPTVFRIAGEHDLSAAGQLVTRSYERARSLA